MSKGIGMIKFVPKVFSLRTKMALLSFGSVFLAILFGGCIVVDRISSTLEKEIGMRAMAIARTLAQMEDIQNNVGKPGGAQVIQPIAERTRHATGVEYIVVTDMNAIRYSHPVEERIGQKFSDQDIGPSLNNNEYISYAEGVLGPSVRAFVPVKVDEGTRQVGVVVVGILTPTVGSILRSIQLQLYYSLAAGLIVGLLGSLYLARRIKMAMFSLEPEEIARLLEERIAIFQAINEGVIAIDKAARITVANEEAKRIIGKEKQNIIGRPIRDVIPDTSLPEVLNTGQAQKHREMVINNTVILVNRVPVRFQGEIIGAVSTFQDKTEVNRLAEELTGVKVFVEALRVQNHEHMNKLHTIAGLIQLEKYQQALDYIYETTEEQQEVTRLVTKNIDDYQVAGLLLGKYGRAKELRAELLIDRNTRLKSLPPHLESSAMVVIIGNLIENALEAVRMMPADRRKIYFSMVDKADTLTISVRDLGPGIPVKDRDLIFEHGYSTKDPTGRGIGLYLVKHYVELAGGTITLHFPGGAGTEFLIVIPKNNRQKYRDR
ncbi:MAG: sensor histidine kinase [Firmicutes bacterium]|nr:sensor histidine kinase [Bacillota bacterium]